MSNIKDFLLEAVLEEATYTGSNDITKNVEAIVAEISRTKRVLNKQDIRFVNFRRFLLTLGFPSNWSIQKLRNSYFHTDNVDFYRMVIGDYPVTLRALKLRSKEFIEDVKLWQEWNDTQ